MTQSFRQAGRETKGKLYRGPIVDAFNRLTQPSIPTENEQILTTTERRGGFGASADRFHYSLSSSPGPGEYHSRQLTESPSLSRKGFGGLISKVVRFKRFQYNSLAPGPGTYNSPVQSQSSVVKLMPPGRSLSQMEDYPSPGHYDPVFANTARLITSTFKSKSKKMSDLKNMTPAPGQYEAEYSSKPSRKTLSPAFCLPVQARKYQINLYEPHSQLEEPTVPGPGAYLYENTQKMHRKSYMFLPSENDRFGESKLKKARGNGVPGPGAYKISEIANERAKVTGAVFMSESERVWISPEKKPPGPAFYKPVQVPKKKSFHLNASKQWL